ncbi:Uncharacterised protein [Mycobacteroides abscessus subsp. abscessus]|uniref:hypothetical protein n=1 Tax=Mycobacteroides abscessus TaxID=36809 RepID=UPI0009A5B4BC|nr:hypothetical protein [Mycobacteroides abscessus]SLJ22869.1 Uncharacterised protein [Mycobacteroides abscessus subsp. abscessus]
MARFAPTDIQAAAKAAAEVPTAVRHLAAVITESVEPLADLPAAATPQESLDALAALQRSQDRVERARSEVIRQLHVCGASPRGIALALGLNRQTIERRIAAAEAEMN